MGGWGISRKQRTLSPTPMMLCSYDLTKSQLTLEVAEHETPICRNGGEDQQLILVQTAKARNR